MNFDYNAIEKIETINFFANCGHQNIFDFEDIEFVDKKNAIKLANSIEWENYTLEKANEITSFLHRKAHSDYNLYWDEYVDEFKKCWNSKIHESILESIKKVDLNDELLLMSAQWDLLHYVMEENYKNHNVPTFFHRLFMIYAAGHYPCGVKNYLELQSPIILIY